MHIENRKSHVNSLIAIILKNYSKDQDAFFLQNNINIGSILLTGFIEENPDFIENVNVRNFIIGFGVFIQRFDNYSDIEMFFSKLSDESYLNFKNSVAYINYDIPEDVKWTIDNDLRIISQSLFTIKRTFQDLTDRLKNPEFEAEIKFRIYKEKNEM